MRSYVVSAVLLACLALAAAVARRPCSRATTCPRWARCPRPSAPSARASAPTATRCTSRARRAWGSTTSARPTQPAAPQPAAAAALRERGRRRRSHRRSRLRDHHQRPELQRRRRDLRRRRDRPARADDGERHADRGARPQRRRRHAGSSNGHIANCVADCRYLWTTGSDEGLTVFDLSDPTHPKHLGAFKVPGDGFTHDVQVDALRHRVGHRRGRHVRLRRANIADPLAPDARCTARDPSVTNTGNSGPSLDPGGANDSARSTSCTTTRCA